MKEKKKHWIQGAVRKPGDFAAATRAVESVTDNARQEEDAAGTLGDRARLAATLMGLRKKKS